MTGHAPSGASQLTPVWVVALSDRRIGPPACRPGRKCGPRRAGLRRRLRPARPAGPRDRRSCSTMWSAELRHAARKACRRGHRCDPLPWPQHAHRHRSPVATRLLQVDDGIPRPAPPHGLNGQMPCPRRQARRLPRAQARAADGPWGCCLACAKDGVRCIRCQRNRQGACPYPARVYHHSPPRHTQGDRTWPLFFVIPSGAA